MTTVILTVPLKKSEPVKWAKPLNSFLDSLYGETSDIRRDVAAFDSLRQTCRDVPADKDGFGALYNYYSQLELLDLKVPFDSVNRSRRIEFTWHDAFDPLQSHSQKALPFEKASTLFNLAALASKCAHAAFRDLCDLSKTLANAESSDDNVKLAIGHLQDAAGVFDSLTEFWHAPLADMQKQTLDFLQKLMLAQAQELFLLKVVRADLEQKQNSLVSKLASLAAIQYGECYALLDLDAGTNSSEASAGSDSESESVLGIGQTPNESSHVRAAIPKGWAAIIRFKSIFYESFAQYFNALTLEAGKKYGEALGYFEKALATANQVLSEMMSTVLAFEKSSAYGLLDLFKSHKDLIHIKLTDLNRDNDLIYHALVPLQATLAGVKALAGCRKGEMHNNAAFRAINDHNYRLFLHSVVPVQIHELLSIYLEQKAQLLRDARDAASLASEQAALTLDYLGLPQSLAEIQQAFGAETSKIPANLVEIAREVSGAAPEVANNRLQILKLRQEIYEKLALAKEQATMNGAGAEIFEEIRRAQRSLLDGQGFDTKLFALADGLSVFEALSEGPALEKFQSLFSQDSVAVVAEPSLVDLGTSSASDGNLVEKQIPLILDKLRDMRGLESHRLKLLGELKEATLADEIGDILVLNSKSKNHEQIEREIFPAELAKFDQFQHQLSELKQEQEKTTSEIEKTWLLLRHNSEVKAKVAAVAGNEARQQKAAMQISEFYREKWPAYRAGIARGASTYQQLVGYVEQILDRISPDMGRLNLEQNDRNAPPKPPHPINSHQIRPTQDLPQDSQQDQHQQQHQSLTQPLIYDQPSVYQPNMYSFFTNRHGG